MQHRLPGPDGAWIWITVPFQLMLGCSVHSAAWTPSSAMSLLRHVSSAWKPITMRGQVPQFLPDEGRRGCLHHLQPFAQAGRDRIQEQRRRRGWAVSAQAAGERPWAAAQPLTSARCRIPDCVVNANRAKVLVRHDRMLAGPAPRRAPGALVQLTSGMLQSAGAVPLNATRSGDRFVQEAMGRLPFGQDVAEQGLPSAVP
jgi:hypothetical protein